MFLLVLARMAGLVRAGGAGRLAPARAAQAPGVALVGAREHATRSRPPRPAPCASSRARDADARLVDAARRTPAEDQLSPAARTWLTELAARDGEPVRWIDVPRDAARRELELPRDAADALLVARRPRGAEARSLLVSIPGAHGPEMSGALEALAAQMSLAIDGALLAEDLHRRSQRGPLPLAGRALQRPDHRARPLAARSSTRARRSSGCSATRAEDVLSTRLRPARAARATAPRLRAGPRGRRRRHSAARAWSSAALRSRDGEWLQFEIRHTNLLDDEHVQRHRPQLPRHQRAQGVRGAARPPGLPRSRHRASPTARCSPTASQHALARARPRAARRSA